MVHFIFFFLFTFLGGAIYATGFPSLFWGSFIAGPIIGLTILFSSTSVSRHKKKPPPFWQDLVFLISFSVGAYTYAYNWIPGMIEVFGDIPTPYNQLVGVLLSFIIFPYLFIFFLLYRPARVINLPGKFLINTPSKRNLFLALCLVLLEYFTPQQFPAHVGHAWLPLAPNLSLAPLGGVPLYSFFGIWIALALASLITSFRLDRWALVGTLLFVGANFVRPLKFLPLEGQNVKTNHLRLVQANIGNFIKMDAISGGPKSLKEVDYRYYDLSTRPSSRPLDLVIWPETAHYHTFNSSALRQNPDLIPPIFRDIILETKAELLIGGYDSSPQKDSALEDIYNAAILLGVRKNFESTIQGNPKQLLFNPYAHHQVVFRDVYHKIRLIPFGETLPFGRFNDIIGRYIANISFFKEGKRRTLFSTRNETYFITLICYEILFSESIRSYLNSHSVQPHFIINLANDSWYGDTAEPRQHRFLAHWRALEFQMPVVRMTNSGISSVLFPDGSESQQLSYGSQDILDLTLMTPYPYPTFYQRWGIFPLIGLYLLILGLLLIFERSPVKEKSLFQ
jgi:apolipoprotein N-acyltransferase